MWLKVLMILKPWRILLLRCKILFTEADDQDRTFSLENNLEEFKTKTAEKAEKIKELETISKKRLKSGIRKSY